MFELELVIMPKSLSSAWLGLTWLISQAKLELKLELKLSFLAWDPKKIASSNAYITKNQVYI